MSLAEEYMSVLIHRPGLTFDPTVRPFSECLQVCTAACSQIIRLATSLASFRHAPGLDASLSSLVFQCALMITFNHCHTSSRKNTHKDDVVRAISFLAQCEGTTAFAHSHKLLAAMSDTRGLLQSLTLVIDGGPHAMAPSNHGNALVNSGLSAGEGIMGEQIQLETPASVFGMDVDGPGLGGLDQLESLDWIFDFNPELPSNSG